jgi:hypothetical protein
VHLHVHIGDDALPRKGRDANAGGRGEANPAGRRNGPVDQGTEQCLLKSESRDGEQRWLGGSQDRQWTYVAHPTPDGDLLLEVRHSGGAEEGENEGEVMDGDPKEMGIERPPGSAALDRRAAFDAKALQEFQTRGNTEFGYAASRAFAKKMAEAFKPQRRS